MLTKLKRSLTLHEGRSRFLYQDTAGKWTIGCGYNISDRGLPDSWIDSQLDLDIKYFYSSLAEHLWFQTLNADRQIILIDMAFMGMKKLLGFVKMIDAIQRRNYDLAAKEIINSDWAKKVGSRAFDLANGMRTGIYTI